MVLVWNELAGGDRDRAAMLVIFNAIFQVVAYALLGWFYLNALPDLLGLDNQGFHVGIWEVGRTTLIFLGIPLTAGYLTRRWGLRTHGRDWFESRVIPRIAPITLYGLLFTIVLLFAIQGDNITAEPLTVARIALPLLAYFAGMWVLGFAVGHSMKLGYPRTATLAFTVASNDFELAIAVAVGVWGASSGQALAGVVGPLIEVPVLVSLVYVALWLRRRWSFGRGDRGPAEVAEPLCEPVTEPLRTAMNCLECHPREIPAIAICGRCGAGLCANHLSSPTSI